jgi:hypothetical protein
MNWPESFINWILFSNYTLYIVCRYSCGDNKRKINFQIDFCHMYDVYDADYTIFPFKFSLFFYRFMAISLAIN